METTVTNGNGTALALAPLAQLVGQLGAVREHLTECFPERTQVIDNILTAVVASEHVLMVGVPGTAKSMLAREFSRCINGRYYEYLFNKFTTPEEFLGPFSIKGLKADRYDRVLKGRIADCDVAFLDEIFKSNSASLNTLLPILNERICFQGGGAIPIPLRVAVAASNELPTDPALRALWDRIMLRSFVEPLHSDAERRRVMLGHNQPGGKRPCIDLALVDAVDLRAEVTVPDHVVDTVMTMRRELEAAGIVYGDRRWVKAMQCVRAFTLVCGFTEASTMSLSVLASCLWDTEDQVADVAKLVAKVAAPHVMKAREIYDTLLEALGDDLHSKPTEEISQMLPKMVTAHKRIAKKAHEAPAGRERDEVRAIAQRLRGEFEALKAELMERHGLDNDIGGA